MSDMDIVEELREAYDSLSDIGGATERESVLRAIAEIERLRAENGRMMALLVEHSQVSDWALGSAWFEERNRIVDSRSAWRFPGAEGKTVSAQSRDIAAKATREHRGDR